MNRVFPVRLLLAAPLLALAGCAGAQKEPAGAPAPARDPAQETRAMAVYHEQMNTYMFMIQMERESTTRDSAAITALLDTAVAAWNRGDLNGFLAPYAVDARYVTSQGQLVGGTAIRRGYESGALGGPRSARLVFQYVSTRSLGDGFRLLVGRWVLTDPATGREQTRMSTFIFRFAVGRWQIMHEHSS